MLALLCLAAGIVAGGLGLLGRPRAGAVANGALAAVFLAFAAPYLISWALSPDAFIRQYGRAALSELPLDLGLAALALIALAGSTLAFARRSAVVFWVGWLVNLPTVALIVYLGFWFHVF